MAGESEDTPSGLPWYVKFFEYWKNRNRIGPGKVELPDCDFFIVGPRRTLRVLRPPLKSDFYYEIATNRPESINDNFFTRWSKRPHSSGNCRCSFRQSDRLSSPEEQIISDQLNRIGTNIRDAEKAGKRVERLEEKISFESQKYQIIDRENNLEKSEKFKSNPIDFIKPQETMSPCDEKGEEQVVKYKIIKDLEQYINVLLEEILDDTVKFIATTEDTLIKDIQRTNKKYSLDSRNGIRAREESANGKIERTRTKEVITLDDISFSFHADESEATRTENRSKDELAPEIGYVNRAFIGTTVDPDSLDFYLRHTMPTEMNLEQLDCTDSGINSVETIEFQPDQEPSLEQSLLQIIDEKLGRSPCRDNMEYLDEQGNDEENVIEGPGTRRRQPVQEKVTVRSSNRKDKLDSTENAMGSAKEKLEEDSDDPKSQLKFKNGMRESLAITEDESKSSVHSTDEKLVVDPEDQEDVWHDQEQTTKSTSLEHNPRDFVMFRKSRKPMIVFLHGFGSSAEIFEHQLEYFSALGYPCIAPDMLGHGMSSAPNRARDYHFNKLLIDLDVVLNHYAFKPDQKCILVAHNYGCSFATALACKYDTSIHQLVLISGGGPTPLAPPSTESAGHWCLRAVLSPFLMCGLHKGILYSARGRQHPYCGPEPVEQWPSHMKYILDGMVWPEGDYVFHRRICTPTLLIHGLRDNGVSLVQECQMERTMLKAFLEAIPVAGHSPMTDCPEQLNHMIHCFIDLWKNKTW